MRTITTSNMGRTYTAASTLTESGPGLRARSSQNRTGVPQVLRFFLCCMVASATARAGESVSKTLSLRHGETLAVAGFSLNAEAEVKLYLESVSQHTFELTTGRSGHAFSVAWIIDATTREKVWYEREAMPQRSDNFPLRLGKGNYEMYLAMVKREPVNAAAERLSAGPRPPLPPRQPHKSVNPIFRLMGPQGVLTLHDKDFSEEMLARATVSIFRATNNSSETRIFQVLTDTRVRIYAVGEAKRRPSSSFDYGWIEDLSRERIVWSMNPRECEFAGGSSKNIVARDSLVLPPGKYALHFETNGSHAYGDWTEEPPYDPNFWGITLWAASEKDAGNLKVLRERVLKKPVLEIAEVGNNQHIVRGLDLRTPLGLRLFCLGEGTWKDGMADYGWIENADTGKTIWIMKFQETTHAGGAEKNRLANKLIHLAPGRYRVHYQTDDSHAFNDWNAPPPEKTNTWGITLFALEQKDAEFVKTFESRDAENKPLAALLRVGNNAYLEKLFTLNEASHIKIVAYGEAHEKTLSDHGWIENDDTGRIVWKMVAEKTKHAGGSNKNRMQVETISLPAGTYKLLYESDDSHAFKNWNDQPPDEPEKYGIAIFISRF